MRRGLRDVKREATGQALAQAAFDLASERGLDGFGTDDVVQRAGYSRRTFANHFSCKEEAVASVALARIDVAGDALADLPADLPLLDAVHAVMLQQFTADTMGTMRELLALAQRHPALEPYVLSVQHRMRQAGHQLLLAAAGDRYPDVYVSLLFGAVYGAASAAMEGTLDVQLADTDADAAAEQGTIGYSSFLELTFDYLRKGF